MSISMSTEPNLSDAVRFKRLAEKLGFRGEGAVNIPVQTSDGRGTSNIIVSAEPLEKAPPGTIVLVTSTGEFTQSKKDDDGNLSWTSLGSNPNISELVTAAGPSSGIVLPPLPPKPDPNIGDTSFITQPVVTKNATAPTSMRKSNGDLKVGSSNKATNMIVATNGEISIAGASRFYRKGATFAAKTADDKTTYGINVAEGTDPTEKDWTWLYAISMENTTNSKNIAALYDVTMRVVNKANGRHLDFVGAFDSDSGEFRMYDGRQGLNITDNTTDADGSTCQNIQRIKFYPNHLKPETSVANRAPIGEYEFKLSAKRKYGDFPPVVIEWAASVIDSDMSMLVDPTVTAGAALNAVAVKPNNTQLLISSGNPSEQMIVARNGEAELAGACRYYRNGTIIAPTLVNGVQSYSINVQDSPFNGLKDWTWVYSLALVNTKNGQALTDVYDVTMTVRAPTGELIFVGSYKDSKFHMIDEEHDLDIDDNLVTPGGQVTQNIQRVRFYGAELGDVELGANSKSPVGTYTFELRANRKIGDAPDLVCTWRAVVVDELPPPPPEPEPEPEPEEPVVTPSSSEEESATTPTPASRTSSKKAAPAPAPASEPEPEDSSVDEDEEETTDSVVVDDGDDDEDDGLEDDGETPSGLTSAQQQKLT